MNIIEKIKDFLSGTKVDAGEINGSSINGITVNADIISVNNKAGHFEIDGEIGKTSVISTNEYFLVFNGGILVDVIERSNDDE